MTKNSLSESFEQKLTSPKWLSAVGVLPAILGLVFLFRYQPELTFYGVIFSAVGDSLLSAAFVRFISR